jgi:hypothetical protein
MPLMPAPPMPTKWMCAEIDELVEHQPRPPQLFQPVGDRRHGARAGRAGGRPAHAARRARIGEELQAIAAPSRSARRGGSRSTEVSTSPAPASARSAGVVPWWPPAMASGTSTDGRPAAQISARVMAPARETTRWLAAIGAGHVVEERDDLHARSGRAPPLVGGRGSPRGCGPAWWRMRVARRPLGEPALRAPAAGSSVELLRPLAAAEDEQARRRRGGGAGTAKKAARTGTPVTQPGTSGRDRGRLVATAAPRPSGTASGWPRRPARWARGAGPAGRRARADHGRRRHVAARSDDHVHASRFSPAARPPAERITVPRARLPASTERPTSGRAAQRRGRQPARGHQPRLQPTGRPGEAHAPPPARRAPRPPRAPGTRGPRCRRRRAGRANRLHRISSVMLRHVEQDAAGASVTTSDEPP